MKKNRVFLKERLAVIALKLTQRETYPTANLSNF